MDIRLLFILIAAIAVLAFFIGRRTAPGGRAVHRLQKDLENRERELAGYQAQMHHFMVDMQSELDRVSGAYRDLQAKMKAGNERFSSNRQFDQVAFAEAHRADPRADEQVSDKTDDRRQFEPPRDYSPVRGTLAGRNKVFA